MLLKFFFKIETSVSMLVMMFWKKSSRLRNSSLSIGSNYVDLLADELDKLVLADDYPFLYIP